MFEDNILYVTIVGLTFGESLSRNLNKISSTFIYLGVLSEK